MDNFSETKENSDSTELESVDNLYKEVFLSKSQGINESNLMVLPLFSVKRHPEIIIEREWVRDGTEVGLKVVGGQYGCPNMYDLDVLLALFRIMLKNQGNRYLLSSDNKVELPEKIHFTFRQLAKEMGINSFGTSTKTRILKSLYTLTEATVYSKFSFKDSSRGDYVDEFKGMKACHIISNFSSFSLQRLKRESPNATIYSPKKMLDSQYVQLDKFFYENLCGNYFKIYDSDKYKKLKSNIAKKLFLILTQWSKGYEKFLTMQTLYDYIGLKVDDNKTRFYYNKEIKKALNQLKDVKFIEDYEFTVNEGVLLIYNKRQRDLKLGLTKYTTSSEVVARLREIGVDYDEILQFCNSNTLDYISALLRYIDDKIALNQVKDVFKFTVAGLPYNKYNVEKYMVSEEIDE